MKKAIVLFLAAVFTCVAWAATSKIGKPLALKKQVKISDIVKNRDKYIGKVVQVKGKVTETCSHAGCYMMLSDDKGNSIKIKRVSSDMVFAPALMGKMATAEGKFVKIEMSKEDALANAKFEAKERKIPLEKIPVETVIWQIETTGAEVIE